MVLGLLRADAPAVMGAPQDWPRWAVLLPHVLAANGYLEHSVGPGEQPGRPRHAWLLDRAVTYPEVHAGLARPRREGE